MYSVLDTPKGRALIKLPSCKKIFVSEGKLIKFQNNMAMLPKDAKIGICKVNHWEMHQIRMTKNKQLLHHNSVIVKYELGEQIPFDEEEILLASLEVLETL